MPIPVGSVEHIAGNVDGHRSHRTPAGTSLPMASCAQRFKRLVVDQAVLRREMRAKRLAVLLISISPYGH